MIYKRRILRFLICVIFIITTVIGSLPALAAKSDNSALILDLDFENMEVGEFYSAGVVEEYAGSKALKVNAQKSNTTLTFDSLVVGECVMSFDVAVNSGFVVGELGVQGGGTPAYVLNFTKDGKIKTYNGKEITRYGDKFKTITVVFNAAKQYFDVYVNETCVASRMYIGVTFDKVVTFNLVFASVDDFAQVYLDNIYSHPSYEKTSKGFVYNPMSKPRNTNKKIILTSKTTIPSEDAQRSILKNASSIHMRSGVVYNGNTKIMTETLPYYKDDEFMVPIEAIEHALGVETDVSDGKINIGDNIVLSIGNRQMTVSGKTIEISTAPELKDNILYLPLKAIAGNGLGKTIQYDDTTVHYGMILISDSGVSVPVGDAFQKLNDFCFYFRPSKERFLADYNASSLKGVHPRLFATAEDFERVREEIKTNAYKKKWVENLFAQCDLICTYPAIKYELRDGVRLMYVSDEFRGYMLTLALGYQLAKDDDPERAKRYFDSAWKHIEVSAKMPDWNPSHHIDVGIMALGFAVAYDWFYDELTDEQKAIMERGVYNNMFWTLNEAIESSHTPYGSVFMSNNHNVFCNAGAMASCIAFMDVYPDIASKLGSDILRILEVFMDKFAPLGAYYEGPSYAGIAITYTVNTLASLIPTMGTAYSIDRAQGFDMVGDYLSNIQSDIAAFNFADSHPGAAYTAAMFWLYKHYKTVGFKDALAERYKNTGGDLYSLLYYDVTPEGDNGESFVKLDNRYEGEEIITMRNTFDDGQVFVGIKAGDTVYAHSHLDAGSFVLDALGTRWAHDFGQDDYNLYYKYDPWDVFRLRAESHNTLLINPDRDPGYVLGSRADVISYESKPKGVITKINMTPLYGTDVLAAKRGYFFTDERRSLVVRDEVTFSKQSDAYWLMYTDADAEIIDENTVILSDVKNPSKKLKIEWLSSSPGVIGFEDAKPFPTSLDIPEQNQNVGFHRLYYKISGKGASTITAKITPLDFGGSDIGLYDVNMDEWKIPDGELNDIPVLDSLTIDGEKYDINNRHITLKVKDINNLPEFEAKSEKYDISISKGESGKEPTVITLTDSGNVSNTITYVISYEEIMDIGKYNLNTPAKIAVSDEPESANPKENAIDGNLDTRWSAENKQWLLLDYGEAVEFDTILMAMYLGDQRTSEISIEISLDGKEYTQLTKVRTSGRTSDYEAFETDKQKARYIRFNFSGTSTGTWNSPTEIATAIKK